MKDNMTEQDALNRLAALCSQAEHCRFELEEKLLRWGIAPDARERIVQWLAGHGFCDDRRYAAAFARDKLRYNKWGRYKIGQALRAKRIADDLCCEALDGIDSEAYAETLRQLLAAKSRSLKCSDAFDRRRRLTRFALGRGFTYQEIKECVGDLGDDDDPDMSADAFCTDFD